MGRLLGETASTGWETLGFGPPILGASSASRGLRALLGAQSDRFNLFTARGPVIYKFGAGAPDPGGTGGDGDDGGGIGDGAGDGSDGGDY